MFNDDSHAWYFAYGSNLWIDQMIERVGPSCVNVRPEVVQLPNYRLAFNMQGSRGDGFANIVTPGDGVRGVIYRCSPAALVLLDGFEVGYDRAPVQVLNRNGRTFIAVAYVAKPEHICSDCHPTEEYLRKIIAGARQHGLPEDYIRQIEAIAAE